jgi:spore germination protein GerM
MLTAWGMVTLILAICIALLVNEMIKSGQDPLNAFKNQNAQVAAKVIESTQNTSRQTREVLLYFAEANTRSLVPEKQHIELTDSVVENCRAALQNLIAGPQTDLTPILPAATKIRAMYLLDNGELIVDFSRELISSHARTKSASLESLLVYGVVNTLTQSNLQQATAQRIEKVRFLFEGAPPQENFPAHIDLSGPVAPNREWIARPTGSPAHD